MVQDANLEDLNLLLHSMANNTQETLDRNINNKLASTLIPGLPEVLVVLNRKTGLEEITVQVVGLQIEAEHQLGVAERYM